MAEAHKFLHFISNYNVLQSAAHIVFYRRSGERQIPELRDGAKPKKAPQNLRR
jgi:hypothetical protein